MGGGSRKKMGYSLQAERFPGQGSPCRPPENLPVEPCPLVPATSGPHRQWVSLDLLPPPHRVEPRL